MTGVQTCALPIYWRLPEPLSHRHQAHSAYLSTWSRTSWHWSYQDSSGKKGASLLSTSFLWYLARSTFRGNSHEVRELTSHMLIPCIECYPRAFFIKNRTDWFYLLFLWELTFPFLIGRHKVSSAAHIPRAPRPIFEPLSGRIIPIQLWVCECKERNFNLQLGLLLVLVLVVLVVYYY